MTVRPQGIQCEGKDLEEKLEEWNTSESVYSEDNNIFHPDDEIIVDPKESLEASIKRVSPVFSSLTVREVSVLKQQNGL